VNKLQFRVLYREFLLRVVDLELLAPQGDITKLLGQFVALLAIVSLWILLPSVGMAAHRQCDAGVLPVRGVLGRVSSQACPATSSPPNPLCPHGHFRATVVILDPQERPADRSFQRQADHSKPIGRPLG
jgi:hypothetical protein